MPYEQRSATLNIDRLLHTLSWLRAKSEATVAAAFGATLTASANVKSFCSRNSNCPDQEAPLGSGIEGRRQEKPKYNPGWVPEEQSVTRVIRRLSLMASSYAGSGERSDATVRSENLGGRALAVNDHRNKQRELFAKDHLNKPDLDTKFIAKHALCLLDDDSSSVDWAVSNSSKEEIIRATLICCLRFMERKKRDPALKNNGYGDYARFRIYELPFMKRKTVHCPVHSSPLNKVWSYSTFHKQQTLYARKKSGPKRKTGPKPKKTRQSKIVPTFFRTKVFRDSRSPLYMKTMERAITQASMSQDTVVTDMVIELYEDREKLLKPKSQ